MFRTVLNNIQAVDELISKLSLVKPGSNQPIYQAEIKEYKSSRTGAQNRLYWIWMKQVSTQMFEAGYALKSDKVWHLYFRQEFLGIRPVEIMGKMLEELISTTELNTKEFTDYLEKIELYAGSEWSLVMPHPEDYREAMGIK